MTSKRSPSKQATTTISPYLMRRHRHEVCDWLKVNGVDPNVVVAEHPISVRGDAIHYLAFVPDAAGSMVDGQPATVARTARCLTAPPDLTQGDREEAATSR